MPVPWALLSIPNIARDQADIQRNAEMIATLLEKRGVSAKLVSVTGANPVVFTSGQYRFPSRLRPV